MLSRRPDVRGQETPVAIVTGLGVTGLAVARALGRRGIPVIGIATGRPPSARSRFIRFLSGPSPLDEAATLDYYLTLGRRLGQPAVLVPTGDATVLLIARHRQTLPEHFRFFVAETELLETITSKRRLVALAERLGLPLPPTILPTSRAELETAIDGLRFPCVIKPEFTHLWRSPAAFAAGIGEVKAIPVETVADLRAWYDRLVALDARLIVQQMVVGPDENHIDYHALIERNGAVTAEFVGRKLRLAPAHYGSGSYVESAHVHEVLEAGRLVVERLRYNGIVNINFKRDSRDGRVYLLEVNPRFSTWTALDVVCGVDLPFYYYRACLGQPYAPPAGYPAGVRWVNLSSDIRAMRLYARDGTWSWPQWLTSVLKSSVDAVFTWDDPGPAWAVLRLSVRLPVRRTRPADFE